MPRGISLCTENLWLWKRLIHDRCPNPVYNFSDCPSAITFINLISFPKIKITSDLLLGQQTKRKGFLYAKPVSGLKPVRKLNTGV